MTEILIQIKSNNILVASGLSWLSAQILKTIIDYFVTKDFTAERLVGAGGMPSAHSAFVSCLALSTARWCGLSSPEFAIAFGIACVVIYDAMGVRRAAGEQAKAINMLTDEIFKHVKTEDKVTSQLKELLGHTPLEVLAGVVLGTTIAMLFKGF